jgi:putative MFS transporter
MGGHRVVASFAYSVLIYMAYIPGYIFGGYLADVLDRKWGIFAAFLSTAVFGTLFGSAQVDRWIVLFGALTAFSAACGSTCIYTYTPENYPTDIRATGMGIASAWGRAGSITLLLIFGVFAVLKGKLFLFMVADVLLLGAAIVVAVLGTSTKFKTLEVSAGESSVSVQAGNSK